jgi:hypothetical protein
MSMATRAVVLAAGLAAAGAHAQDSDRKVDVHGLGGWVYGNTDGNRYLGGVTEGNYENANTALNITAQPEPRLRVVTQVEWRLEGPETEVEIDFAFAEWRFGRAANLRVGKVKQPFGLSTEVFDVGPLRPFYALPQAVYGPVGFVAEGYLGLGVTGERSLAGPWNLHYDAYFGGQVVEEFEAPEAALLGEPLEGEGFHDESTRDLVGGRLTLDTPGGLNVGASGYSGKVHGAGRRNGWGLHAEYASAGWSLRAELARENAPEHGKRGGYLEAARRLGPHWQVAGQWGRVRSELSAPEARSLPRLLEHDEWALGLNYWITPAFVFKASFHHVQGNRLAVPEADELLEAIAAGELRAKTKLVLVGAQFTF